MSTEPAVKQRTAAAAKKGKSVTEIVKVQEMYKNSSGGRSPVNVNGLVQPINHGRFLIMSEPAAVRQKRKPASEKKGDAAADVHQHKVNHHSCRRRER